MICALLEKPAAEKTADTAAAGNSFAKKNRNSSFTAMPVKDMKHKPFRELTCLSSNRQYSFKGFLFHY